MVSCFFFGQPTKYTYQYWHFIAIHLEEHAKSSKVVIAIGGLIIALARALGFSDQISTLQVSYTPGLIDLLTCLCIDLFKSINGGQLWLSHHSHALFVLPNHEMATVTYPSNLIYDDVVDDEYESDDAPIPVIGHNEDDDTELAIRDRSDRSCRWSPSSDPTTDPSSTSSAATLPCFRWFSTISINYTCRIRRSLETNKTWLTWFIVYMSRTSGLSLPPIGGPVDLQNLIELCKSFRPSPSLFYILFSWGTMKDLSMRGSGFRGCISYDGHPDFVVSFREVSLHVLPCTYFLHISWHIS